MSRRALLLGCLLALSPAISQATVLMMVEGLTGPSKFTNYSGWFFLKGLSWEIDRSKVAEPHGVTASMESSAAVATLIQLSATGTPLKKIVFDSVHTGTADSGTLLDMRLTCEDALIRASSISTDSDERPVVELTIRCGRLLWENYDYTTGSKTAAAAGKGSWNFKTNTP